LLKLTHDIFVCFVLKQNRHGNVEVFTMSKLLCAVALLCLGSCLSAQTVSLKLFVGTMGRSDEAERFRLLLSEEAEKAGFIGVDRPEVADVILTGHYPFGSMQTIRKLRPRYNSRPPTESAFGGETSLLTIGR
jgi:hypothetical protein